MAGIAGPAQAVRGQTLHVHSAALLMHSAPPHEAPGVHSAPLFHVHSAALFPRACPRPAPPRWLVLALHLSLALAHRLWCLLPPGCSRRQGEGEEEPPQEEKEEDERIEEAEQEEAQEEEERASAGQHRGLGAAPTPLPVALGFRV